MVTPTIVAGVNALGRGQDRQSLIEFMTTIAQTLGPEAMMKYINSDEVITRLAASQGIEVLNLVKSRQEQQQEAQQQQQAARQEALTGQAAQLQRNQIDANTQQQQQPAQAQQG